MAFNLSYRYRGLLAALLLVGCSSSTHGTETTDLSPNPAGHPWATFFAHLHEAHNYPGIDSIIIQRRGEVLAEAYFGGWSPDKLHDARSSFKSVTSLLLGIAIDRGDLRLDDRVIEYLPETWWRSLAPDDPKLDMRVEHLVSMTSGLACEEFYDDGPECESEMVESADWVKFAWGRPMAAAPGESWAYNSEAPMILGFVIAQATGMKIEDFARQFLFEPLEIHHYRWTFDPKGQAMTAGSFFMRPGDWAKLGQLVLQRGRWQSRQLISKSWIELSTRAHRRLKDFNFTYFGGYPRTGKGPSRNIWPDQRSTSYGYYWYREQLRYGPNWQYASEVIFASGNGGQYIMVLPGEELVVVFTASHYGNWRGKWPFDILIRHILPELHARGQRSDIKPTKNKPPPPAPVAQHPLAGRACDPTDITAAAQALEAMTHAGVSPAHIDNCRPSTAICGSAPAEFEPEAPSCRIYIEQKSKGWAVTIKPAPNNGAPTDINIGIGQFGLPMGNPQVSTNTWAVAANTWIRGHAHRSRHVLGQVSPSVGYANFEALNRGDRPVELELKSAQWRGTSCGKRSRRMFKLKNASLWTESMAAGEPSQTIRIPANERVMFQVNHERRSIESIACPSFATRATFDVDGQRVRASAAQSVLRVKPLGR